MVWMLSFRIYSPLLFRHGHTDSNPGLSLQIEGIFDMRGRGPQQVRAENRTKRLLKENLVD